MEDIIKKLIDAREKAGLTVQDVQKKTHISMKQLELLEAGRTDEMGPPVYVRGFMRRYARAVGLDEESLFDYPSQPDESPVPEKKPTRFAPPRRDLRPLLGFVSVLLVGTVAAFLMRDAIAAFFQPSPDLPPTLPVEENDTVDDNNEEPEPEPDPEPELPEPEVVLEDQTGRVLRYTVTHAEKIEVRVVFSGEVWYRPAVDGNQLRGDSASDGDELEWTAESSVELLLGNAPATVVFINGHEIVGSELSLPGNSAEFIITLEHEDD